MSARLASGIWVGAYLRRLDLAGIPAYVLARGDEVAGAVIVKLALPGGQARAYARLPDLADPEGGRCWEVLAEGPEPEVDAALERQRRFDPDLWLIEVESRDGRHLLDEPGLAG
ncbi:MAG: DUF1491 family protein [Alphaproteobacteria bacterium]|nr:MAG: DUF1491 family protein [Alphaproteobacteria bacterium]